MHPRLVAALAVVAAGCTLAACGSSSPPATTSTTSTSTTSTTGVQATVNLTVTASLDSELLAAGAASHELPVSDYTGLTAGLTFHAYDPTDNLYWAAAQLVPSTSSEEAQVGAQDDGAYDLYTSPPPGTTWTAYNDGLGGVPNSSCAVIVPAAVRTVWDWSQTTPCGVAPGV
jgi:hypothetical protein